ncbi:MAG: hypothetical protein RIA09_15870 [Hoeflea sp.]|jgi:hypothetical protein|uniref:hypothetical protein n=1 Tax=Hoeflea sp. TaxID=1940281 RepID=UPI0032EB26DA
MTKVLFQDKPGNAPITVAFVSFREARALIKDTARDLRKAGVQLSEETTQRIVAANGAKYWLS